MPPTLAFATIREWAQQVVVVRVPLLSAAGVAGRCPGYLLMVLIHVLRALVFHVDYRQFLVRQRLGVALTGLAVTLPRLAGPSLGPPFSLTPVQRKDDRRPREHRRPAGRWGINAPPWVPPSFGVAHVWPLSLGGGRKPSP